MILLELKISGVSSCAIREIHNLKEIACGTSENHVLFYQNKERLRGGITINRRISMRFEKHQNVGFSCILIIFS